MNAIKCNDNGLRPAEDLGGAESGAVDTERAPIDPDLAQLIDAWPTLPDAVKARILGFVEGVATMQQER